MKSVCSDNLYIFNSSNRQLGTNNCLLRATLHGCDGTAIFTASQNIVYCPALESIYLIPTLLIHFHKIKQLRHKNNSSHTK